MIQRDIVKVGFISKVSYVSKEVYERVTILDTIETHEFDRVSIFSDILRKNWRKRRSNVATIGKSMRTSVFATNLYQKLTSKSIERAKDPG